MNILYLTDSADIHGAEANLLDVLANIDLAQHQVFVGVPSAGPITHRLAGSGIRFFLLSFPAASQNPPGFREWFVAVRAAVALSDYIRKNGIEIVHSITTTAYLVGGIAARRAGVPAVWHAHRLRPLKRLRRLMESSAGRIIAPWNCVAEALSREGVASARICRLNDGIDFGSVVPCPGKVLPEREALPKEAYIFGVVSKQARPTGRATFWQAARAVVQRAPRARFWTVGNRGQVLDPDVGRFPLSASAALGERNDLGDIYHAMSCVVIPSVEEYSGRVAVEAMCAGRPIIASDVGAHSELMREEGGLLVSPGDAPALADAMLRVMEDTRLAAELGAAARRRITREHAIGQVVEKVFAMYGELVG